MLLELSNLLKRVLERLFGYFPSSHQSTIAKPAWRAIWCPDVKRAKPMISFGCLILLWTACGCAAVSVIPDATTSTSSTPPTQLNPNFQVLNALTYSNQPDLTTYGIETATVEGPWTMFPGWPSSNVVVPPDPSLSSQYVQQAEKTNSRILWIDIEGWPGNQSGYTGFAEDALSYVETISAFQHYAPSLKIGEFGFTPIRNYDVIHDGPGTASYQGWQTINDYFSPVAGQANILFPCLYTYSTIDENDWKTFALAMISEARRIGPGKPVYVFLWPQYEDTFIYTPTDYWRMELETARQYADGAVLYGGGRRTTLG